VGLCLLLEYATQLPQSLLDLGLYSLQQGARDKVQQGVDA